MGKYKGNVGHLMQHWTLCEVLRVANEHAGGLSYIDAHAMSPWATECTSPDVIFDNMKTCLPGNGSVYEQAWHNLSQQHQLNGYPNSAAFVRHVWERNYSLTLCEKESQTADEIEGWVAGTSNSPNCTSCKLFRGDWRDRFEDGLPSPSETGLQAGSLTLVSFDPTMYSRHSPAHRDSARLYSKDLDLVLVALEPVKGPTIILLSTYTANGNNPQCKVIHSVNSVLRRGRFQQTAMVKANGHMMSLVYARDVDWGADLAGLPSRFEEWRRR